MIGIAFGRNDPAKGFASDLTTRIVESHLHAAISSTHEESIANHYSSCSIVD
jgi:hypothetical protein